MQFSLKTDSRNSENAVNSSIWCDRGSNCSIIYFSCEYHRRIIRSWMCIIVAKSRITCNNVFRLVWWWYDVYSHVSINVYMYVWEGLTLSVSCIHQQIKHSLVQKMTFSLLGAKPLSPPILIYFILDYWEEICQLWSKIQQFHIRKWIWKRHLQIVNHVFRLQCGEIQNKDIFPL